ncbi:MAG TPA: M28 family peptidase [Gemmatimonadales bacterium]|nr:M28 family peptidase [Gemmatimonadales bacterium]
MRRILPLLCCLLAAPLAAQQAAPRSALDSILLATPDTAMARRHSLALSSRTHVAGTPAQESTAAYVLGQMAAWGLDTSRATFTVYLAAPESVSVVRIRPTPLTLSLPEPPIPGDPYSSGPQWPTVNGYAGAGDVTGPVVYANYGLPDDYRVLDSLGVSVRGAIVVARYGRSHRGIKVREAEARGALGVILYTDPGDDGAAKGPTFPDGPWRPAHGMQRGSVKLSPGDPSTPGWPAVDGARRVPLAQMDIPHIPSVPMGAANAAELLTGLDGPAVPAAWKGGLGIDYRAGGGGAVTVHVTVRLQTGDSAFKRITNTFGILRGSTWPDEVVIIGGHRDAWGPGSWDNISGTVSVLETARAWAAAANAGFRPRRTLIFATWDAEEWGLVGSSEYAESQESALRQSAVAYLNQDAIAAGRAFGGAATPTLRNVVREAVRLVPAPGDTGSVYASWRALSKTPADSEPAMGNLGGGSDFAGFYNHLGIASADWGFGGGQGIYHSQYDDPMWMERFGDPGWVAHQASARITGLVSARLAQADVVPFDVGALADEVTRLATAARDSAARLRMTGAPFARLLAASRALRTAADAFAAAEARGTPTDAQRLARVNTELREAERQLARPSGLVGRPWYRNLLYAADRDNGYADVPLPGVAEALRDRDRARLAREVADLAQRLAAARARVVAAQAALR